MLYFFGILCGVCGVINMFTGGEKLATATQFSLAILFFEVAKR